MATLDQLSDRMAIHDLMIVYARAVDGRDWALYREVFTPRARIDYTDSGGPVDELDAIVKWLAEALQPFAGLQHNMTNHWAEIDGDTARACTYFVAHHTVFDGSGGEELLSVGGFYQDRLVRTPAGWRISERAELGTWMQGPYPDDVAKPPWYGTARHHRPALPG